MTYQQTIKYLYGLQKSGIKFGLSRISSLLKSFNNPQDILKTIHIAGTNGKGSTGAILSSILIRAGFKVGFYISPHLVSLTERIKINEREISEEKVVELTGLIRKRLNDGINDYKITFFEFVTALAILYFIEEKVDFAIMEVGMGGRLDATNIVKPIISIITNISQEHEKFLGKTMAEIAREKAGIIKKESVLISAATQPEVLALFKKTCLNRKTDFYQVGKDFRAENISGQSFNYSGKKGNLSGLKINLLGKHQITNATLALGAIEVLKDKGCQIDKEAIYQGLARVNWPGRLEIVKRSPLIILDGAHNPMAAEALKKSLSEEFDYKRLFLILGIMEDKNFKAIISKLAPLAFKVIFTKPKCHRSTSPQLLYEHAGRFQKVSQTIESVEEAIKYSLASAQREDLICITGSLFTVGEAKEFFQAEAGKF
jgi:dihydrofolate synthase/folylpolyglutamate synthase